MKWLALILLLIIGSYELAYSDSPLTSTYFCVAYYDVEVVKLAMDSNGIITEKFMDYMLDEKNPIDIKLAIINALSWDVDGKNNSEIFWKYLKKRKGYKSLKHFLEIAPGYEILCMAYLKALDNYFDVKDAMKLAEKAVEKNPKSFSFNIILALIKAQIAMDIDWCLVFQLTDNVRKNKTLSTDMKKEAIIKIYDYMDLYGRYC